MTETEEERAGKEPCDEAGGEASCPPLVSAYGVRNSTGTPLSWDEVQSGARDSEFEWVWVHLDAGSGAAAAWAHNLAYLPTDAANAMFATETRPRMTRFDNGIMVNLRGVNHNPGAEPEDMVSLRIWADPKHVITTRRRVVQAISDVRAIIEKPKSGPKTPGDFVVLLTARITHAIEPYVEEVTDEIDQLEDTVLDESERSIRKKLAEARRLAVQLRRYIAPQRDAINAMSLSDISLFDQKRRMQLREISDAVTRMTEEIDAARERAMILHEQIMDQRSEEMNRNMLILSTATAVFLPMNFLVGLLGTNVAGIPGADAPYAFWVVLGISVTIGAVLLGFFRARDWL